MHPVAINLNNSFSDHEYCPQALPVNKRSVAPSAVNKCMATEFIEAITTSPEFASVPASKTQIH